MVKNCQKPNKERNTRTCYKCNKVEHITRDYRSEQKIKNRSIQKNTDEEINDK